MPGVQVYIDNGIVYADNEEEHLKKLEAVLWRAAETGIKCNKNKCKFGLSKVKYLGHIISAECLKPDDSKVQGILDMKEPSNKQEL